MITRDVIAYWEAKREGRHTWQQRSAAQSLKARKGVEMRFAGKKFAQDSAFKRDDVMTWALRRCRPAQRSGLEEDTMEDLILREGVAVVYPSNLRYAATPEDAWTIDMFDATVDLPQEFYAGTQTMRISQRTIEFNTSMVLREEMPEFMTDKLTTLSVALKLRMPERPGAAFVVTIPGVGAAFASGAAWVLITKEDLRGTRWE